ncbi:MAG: hypothetical protein EBV03_03165, partial [Proteobacteria bacterium]|nr:hypothetical protein [Pseudomonadota bacterium]
MTLSAENAKQEKRAQISDMVGEAKRLGSAILSARTPEEARSILGQLHQLAGSPVAMGSSIARMVVTGCISMGERICEYLQEVAAMEALNQQNEQRYAINANNNEGLAGFLDKKELFGKNEREWFERINPDEKRLIAVLDKQGVKRGEALINGQRLRDSAAIVAAYSEYDTLKKDPKALAEYNKLVYGNENGPTNDAERARGEQRIKDAILDVEGDAAKRAPSPEKQKDAGERVKRDIAKLERA